MSVIGKQSSSQGFDVRHRRPDYVVHLQVDENTTTRFLAYRSGGSAAAKGGGFANADVEAQRISGKSIDIRVGLNENASINSMGLDLSTINEDYDAKGAMYFSIAVILIYGISIALLVAASTLRRSHSDYELKSFMRSYSRVDVERRTREKQRARAVLQRLTLPSLQQPSRLIATLAAPPPALHIRTSSGPASEMT